MNKYYFRLKFRGYALNISNDVSALKITKIKNDF